MSNGSEVSIIMSFIAGILTFFSPCILPLFPSYITYITGRSFQEIKDRGEAGDILKLTAFHSIFFIIGFSIVFIFFGVAFSYLGGFFGIKKIWLERIGGLLIIIFGLHISGILNLKFLNFEKGFIKTKRSEGYIGSLLVGMAFSTGWTPCVGPILSSILIYATTFRSLPRSAVLLLVYSLGLGVPFFVASICINQFMLMLNRIKNFIRFIPIITGIFLVCMGALLFFGRFSWVSGIFLH